MDRLSGPTASALDPRLRGDVETFFNGLVGTPTSAADGAIRKMQKARTDVAPNNGCQTDSPGGSLLYQRDVEGIIEQLGGAFGLSSQLSIDSCPTGLVPVESGLTPPPSGTFGY